MQEVKLAHVECSHPPLHDDVSDEYISYFSNYYIDEYENYIHSYHDSPIHPKWVEKTLEAAGNLAGNPLDPRKNRSKFHTNFSTCEVKFL